jgi:histidinol-phosphate aminotransferase
MPILGLAPSSEPIHPPHFDIEHLIRPNILALHPYRCARDDYQSGILLDANENALGHSISSPDAIPPELEHSLSLDLHRYPSPSHDAIKSRFAELRGFPPTAIDHVFLGVGSDEIIDLLIRVCAVPGKDKVLITPPTYGMYSVCAQVNDVGIVKCNLQIDDKKEGLFELRVKEVRNHGHTLFLCRLRLTSDHIR